MKIPQTARYDVIFFETKNHVLKLSVDPETDEIIIEVLQAASFGVSCFEPSWAGKFIGKRIFDLWPSTNIKGYQDVLLIGIEDLCPTLVLTAIASEIRLSFVDDFDASKDISMIESLS